MFGFFRKRKQGDGAPVPHAGAPTGNATDGSQSARAMEGPTPSPSPASSAPAAPVVLSGRRVTVFGMGASGQAAARLAAREGALVTVADERTGDAVLAAASGLPEGTTHAFGAVGKALTEADLVVLSPGVPRAHPELQAAESAGVPVIGEVELAFQHLSAPVIGITGTNGKSTVTSMIGHILSGWKEHVFTGGNLGAPLCEAALSTTAWDFLVVELSSFQLESITTFRPAIGVLLNLAPDHLDRYPSVSAYYRAKFRLFENMSGYALLNHADENTLAIADHYLKNARPVLFNVQDPAMDGVRVADGRITVKSGDQITPLCPVSDLKLVGAHNLENAQAAAAACLLAGCPPRLIAAGLSSFTALPHRMEVVAQRDGVTWINDSKATNPASVVKALEGFSEDQPVILLLGGRDKGGDLFTVREHVFLHARKVILFGEAAEKFRIVLQGFADLEVVDTLSDAVDAARAAATAGDTVLLSPACASFDQFTNYMARGDEFRQLAVAP
ncbi:MAG: UDP-N-acetylmuramoyl-L-alanine--D-glutamate ligase [Nitrospirota bacterium]|nr:UDP-N-acetylmuramoyl-L-alanine--D-glutamate ligase [Nitrospirota bacterium]